jgi:hypothetical protein
MANAAKRGLKLAERNDGVDGVLVGIAERLAAREIVSVEEVAYLANVYERCLATKTIGWSGTVAWVEWQLAGGDTGQKWVARRSTPTVVPEQRAAPNELSEGDFVSWDGGMGRVEYVMRDGSLQGQTATADSPLAVITPFDDDEPEDYLVVVMVSELEKIDEPAAASKERSHEVEVEERAVSLVPSEGMAAAARRGLKLHEDGRSGDGLKPETVSRAKRIAAREELTPEHVREMRAWFARHKVDRRPGWDKAGEETPGFVAWELWGGNAGQEWSESKVKQMDGDSEADESREVAVVEVPAKIVEEAAPVVVESPKQERGEDFAGKIASLKATILRNSLHRDS